VPHGLPDTLGRLGTACPRYFGAACHITGFARIGLSWDGPATLRVTRDSPGLEWTLTATSNTSAPDPRRQVM
jgi:hypothetical protein